MQKEKRLFLSHFLYQSAWQSSCTVFSNLVNGVFNGPTIFGRTHFYQKKKAYMLRYWHIRLGHVIAVILVVIVNISRKFSKAKKNCFSGGENLAFTFCRFLSVFCQSFFLKTSTKSFLFLKFIAHICGKSFLNLESVKERTHLVSWLLFKPFLNLVFYKF